MHPQHFLRVYPKGHPLGNRILFVWQVCSMTDVVASGTSDDLQDAMDQGSSALMDYVEAET
jgi:hypothetical protein